LQVLSVETDLVEAQRQNAKLRDDSEENYSQLEARLVIEKSSRRENEATMVTQQDHILELETQVEKLRQSANEGRRRSSVANIQLTCLQEQIRANAEEERKKEEGKEAVAAEIASLRGKIALLEEGLEVKEVEMALSMKESLQVMQVTEAEHRDEKRKILDHASKEEAKKEAELESLNQRVRDLYGVVESLQLSVTNTTKKQAREFRLTTVKRNLEKLRAEKKERNMKEDQDQNRTAIEHSIVTSTDDIRTLEKEVVSLRLEASEVEKARWLHEKQGDFLIQELRGQIVSLENRLEESSVSIEENSKTLYLLSEELNLKEAENALNEKKCEAALEDYATLAKKLREEEALRAIIKEESQRRQKCIEELSEQKSDLSVSNEALRGRIRFLPEGQQRNNFITDLDCDTWMEQLKGIQGHISTCHMESSAPVSQKELLREVREVHWSIMDKVVAQKLLTGATGVTPVTRERSVAAEVRQALL